MRKIFIFTMMSALFIILAIALNACSGGKSPVEPTIKDSDSPALPDSSINLPSNRDVLV